MPPMSRGRPDQVPKARQIVKKSKKTASTQNHRFEPFSRRIALLKIKPVRLNAGDAAHAELEDEQSHFRVALEEWRDRNMSMPFVEVAEVVEPLCQNLPQVIHNEEYIVDALLQSLPRANDFSLEPILSLTVQLAYDIGQRFEKYFERLVKAVSTIAATHDAVEVVEWSFNCLAALFKHFERLIVQDVRPLYDLMSPLLGKVRQKSFVCRFTAEAFSFLVRKAATASNNSGEVLDSFARHVFEALQRTPSQQRLQHQRSTMTMYAEAIKGVQGGIRGAGPAILRSLLDFTRSIVSDGESEQSLLVQETVEGIVTAVIHHADADGFAPAMDVVLDFARSCSTQQPDDIYSLCADVLFIVLSVRKATRICDRSENGERDHWGELATVLDNLVQAINARPHSPPRYLVHSILKTLAVYMQYCPLRGVDQAGPLLDRLDEEYWQQDFIPFCILAHDAGAERFARLLQGRLESFVVRHWRRDPSSTSAVLPRLPNSVSLRHALAKDDVVQRNILDELANITHAYQRRNSVEDSRLRLLSRYLDICQDSALPDATKDNIWGHLRELILRSLEFTEGNPNPQTSKLVLSKCLVLLDSSDQIFRSDGGASAGLLSMSKTMGANIGFMKAIRKHLHHLLTAAAQDQKPEHDLIGALIANLRSSDTGLRLLSLETLVDLCKYQQTAVPAALTIAVTIESSTFDVNSIRAIAMNIRKLGQPSSLSSGVQWLGRALVSYLFGLLNVQLTPILDDVSESLKALSSESQLQHQIMVQCIDWLQHDTEPNLVLIDNTANGTSLVERTSEFQCTNLMQLQQISQKCSKLSKEASSLLKQAFDAEISLSALRPPTSRSHALRVLCKLVSTAEKSSRLLVPIFLEWFGMDRNQQLHDIAMNDEDDDLPDEPEISRATQTPVSREDRRSMLTLFSSFRNPRVLFKADEVNICLLHELCSGDAEFQRLALKALLTWMSPATKPYEENLINLLDEARFRNELTVFLASEDENSIIRSEHTQDLLPILLRLLYGRCISRANHRGGQHVRRRAALLSIARFGHGALGMFINIALSPFDSIGTFTSGKSPSAQYESVQSYSTSPRMQTGYLGMIHAILETLPNLVGPYVSQLADVVLLCLLKSCKALDGPTFEHVGHKSDVEHKSLFKSIRQDGLRCLQLLFQHCPDYEWDSYVRTILEKVVEPRTKNLPVETAQGISAILRLLSTWASNLALVNIFLDNRTAAATQVADCLLTPSIRDEVKLYILKDIIGNLVELAWAKEPRLQGASQRVTDRLRTKLAQIYLNRIATLLMGAPTKEVLDAGVIVVVKLAPFLEDAYQIDSLVEAVFKLLSPEIKGIPPHLKSKLLSVLDQYLSKSNAPMNDNIFDAGLRALSMLFSYFLDAPSRALLARVFQNLVTGRPEYECSGRVCHQLNSFSSSRLSEPDYDLRLQAVNAITGEECATLGSSQWRPIIHNLLYLIRDDAQFSSIRSGASEGLRAFLRAAFSNEVRHEKVPDPGMLTCIDHELLPALCRGMREKAELIRLEYLRIMAVLIAMGYSSTTDMLCLLENDTGSCFFDEILHIQQNRRIQALRRLATNAPKISSSNISRIILPLVETVISTGNEGSQAVTDEAIRTLEAIVIGLEWTKYRHLVKQMVGEKARFETKQSIRLLGSVVNALLQAHHVKSGEAAKGNTSALARSLPSRDVVANTLTKGCLSQLLEYTHFINDRTVDLRIIVATIAVKMIMTFSTAEVNAQLPAVIMDICNVLRSKAQEARDAARKTLSEVSGIIGPTYFGFLIKQLKSSLQRGTRLHVMSYTVHALLVVATPKFEPGDIDYCSPDIMNIIMEDIYGNVGQEKESDGFTSKMKEVRKKALGYDSLELLCSVLSPNRVGSLLQPLKSQLARPKTRLEKSDELLRRIQEGLRRNGQFNDRQALMLCYEVLRDSLQAEDTSFIASSPIQYKLAAFALNLCRRTIDKHEVLKTRENLQGFLPLLTRALTVGEESMMEAALRLFAAIVKLPIPELDQNAGEYLKLAKNTLDGESSTTSPLAQAALRFVAALLRHRPDAIVKQSEFEYVMAYMLKRITPDLHEPAHSHERGRQVGAFKQLKAALGRGVLITEVYDVMDTVREVIVTSPEAEIRSSARSVYSRFILDYFPEEGKGFLKQIEFLKKNLQYEYAHGRESVLDTIGHLLYKKQGNIKSTQTLTMLIWQDLLDLLVTDTNPRSRDMARTLLVKLFEGIRESTTRVSIQGQLTKLVDAQMPDLIQRAGYQGWNVYLDVDLSATREARMVLKQARVVIIFMQTAMKGNKVMLTKEVLLLYDRLCRSYPSIAFGQDTADVWAVIANAGASSSQTIIRSACLRLIKLYLEDFARFDTRSMAQRELPLRGSAGLALSRKDLTDTIISTVTVFKGDADSEVTAQASQVLVLASRLPLGDNAPRIISQIMSRLTGIIRQEDTPSLSRLNGLRLMVAISERQSTENLEPTIQEMLFMLSNLTDSEIAPKYGEEVIQEQLNETAQQIFEILKTRIGANEFIKKFQTVQTAVRERREERRAKRSIQVVSQPVEAGREKSRKGAAKREKRKERNEAFAGRRRGY